MMITDNDVSGLSSSSEPTAATAPIREVVDEGMRFSSVKPWLGNSQPPSWWDPSTLKSTKPDITLELDYVYGYRARQAHENVHWVDEPTTLVYHAAAVCVVCNIQTRSQIHFLGHDDDVLCLAYNRTRRLAASGGLGAHATAPIMVWSVDNASLKIKISGILEYGVLSVCFSLDGTRVFGLGDDSSHTIGVFDVDTGVCLAKNSGDKNKVVHMIADTTAGRDSKRHFISVGVSHVKFWGKTPKEETLTSKKAIGGDIAKQTMVSACCTMQYVLVGNVSGAIYVFSDGVLVNTIQAHAQFCGALHSVYNTVYSGGRDGLLKKWNFELQNGKVEQQWDLNPANVLSAKPMLVNGQRLKRYNGARAICVVNDKIAIGTCLGGVYTITDGVQVEPLLETHFEDAAGNMDELWGMDVHPSEPLFCSSGDDATLRLWNMERGAMIMMANVTFPSRSCCFSHDGSMIAVGHENGAFSVWDAMTLVPIVPFTRKRESRVQCIAFSPDGRFLAMSMGQGRVVDVYFVKRNFEYVGFCDSVAAQVLRLDWSLDSSMITCSTSCYEATRFNIPSCRINMLPEVYDEVWATHSCCIGWGVQGIWEGCSDGTDVNACGRSRSGKYLGVGYDSCKVRLFNYPCIPKTFENSTKATFPQHREYKGHSSHVTQVHFSADDRYLLTCGGMDLTILRWRIVKREQALAETLLQQGQTNRPKRSAQEAVEEGIIQELDRGSRKQNFIDVQRYDEDPVPAYPPSAPGAAPPLAPAAAAGGGLRPGGGAPVNGTARARANSARQPASRLHETTDTLRIKATIARRHREHLERVQSGQKRFNSFV